MSDELNNGVNWTQVNSPSIWGSSTDPLWRVRIADSTNALSVARCAAEESITIIQAHRAEIERLTAALATANAARDAAKRKIRQALAELQSEVDRDTDYDSAYIDEAHAILYNALTPEERAATPVYDWEPQPAAAPAVDAAPVGELTDAESARLTTSFLHTMMVCGEVRDVFAGEFAAGIQQNVELENERALLSWRDRDLDSAMLHLINASARNAELIRRLQERKTR